MTYDILGKGFNFLFILVSASSVSVFSFLKSWKICFSSWFCFPSLVWEECRGIFWSMLRTWGRPEARAACRNRDCSTCTQRRGQQMAETLKYRQCEEDCRLVYLSAHSVPHCRGSCRRHEDHTCTHTLNCSVLRRQRGAEEEGLKWRPRGGWGWGGGWGGDMSWQVGGGARPGSGLLVSWRDGGGHQPLLTWHFNTVCHLQLQPSTDSTALW